MVLWDCFQSLMIDHYVKREGITDVEKYRETLEEKFQQLNCPNHKAKLT